MNWLERVRTISRNLAEPFVEGHRLAQTRIRAREEENIAGYVTFFHSPEFYNPTRFKLRLLEGSARFGISTPGEQMLLDAVMNDSEMRIEERRNRAVNQFLSCIPNEERRKEVHLKALERALFEWKKQAGREDVIVDQETYRSNVNRLLDKINRLKAPS